jgi:hypothetical protein
LTRALLSSRRRLLALSQLVLVLLFSSSAFAAGRVEWKSKTLKERDDKSWRVEVSIFMPKAPDVAHVPMKFEFQPTAYYARDMTDGDKLVEHTVPLTDRQSLIESVDVGFLDSGSGKIEPRTRFSFKVTRAHGYEAGEYKVTIRDTRNGQVVGTPQTLKFQGENETIDRRAMVFASKDKKKDTKKEEAKSEADSSEKPAEEAAPKEESTAEAPAPDDADTSAAEPPPAIEEKPGGCGCRSVGSSREPALAGSLALLAALGALVRRRQSARAAT